MMLAKLAVNNLIGLLECDRQMVTLKVLPFYGLFYCVRSNGIRKSSIGRAGLLNSDSEKVDLSRTGLDLNKFAACDLLLISSILFFHPWECWPFLFRDKRPGFGYLGLMILKPHRCPFVSRQKNIIHKGLSSWKRENASGAKDATQPQLLSRHNRGRAVKGKIVKVQKYINGKQKRLSQFFIQNLSNPPALWVIAVSLRTGHSGCLLL